MEKEKIFSLISFVFFIFLLFFSFKYIAKNDTLDREVFYEFSPIAGLIGRINEAIINFTSNYLSFLVFGLIICNLLLATLAFFRNRPRSFVWFILLIPPFILTLLALDRFCSFTKFWWVYVIFIAGCGFVYGVMERSLKMDREIASLKKDVSFGLRLIILIIILSYGFFLRTYRVDVIPEKVDGDILNDISIDVLEVFYDQRSPLWFFSIRREFKTCDEPFYMATMGYFFKIFGTSILTVRLSTVFYGMLQILLFYLVLSKLYGRCAGLIGAWLLAVFPFHIGYCRYGHSFHMVIFLFLLAILFMGKIKEGRKLPYFFLWGLVCGMTILFHLSALSVVIMSLISLVMILKDELKNEKKIIISLLLFFLGLLIGSLQFWANLKEHNFGNMLKKGVIKTKYSKSSVNDDQNALQKIIYNLKFTKNFIYRNKTPGEFFSGFNQYYPANHPRPFLHHIILGLIAFGSGYCIYRWKEIKYGIICYMLISIPIPAILSFPLPKRMTAVSIAFLSAMVISLLKIGSYSVNWAKGWIKIFPRTFVFLLLILIGLEGVRGTLGDFITRPFADKYDFIRDAIKIIEDGYYPIFPRTENRWKFMLIYLNDLRWKMGGDKFCLFPLPQELIFELKKRYFYPGKLAIFLEDLSSQNIENNLEFVLSCLWTQAKKERKNGWIVFKMGEEEYKKAFGMRFPSQEDQFPNELSLIPDCASPAIASDLNIVVLRNESEIIIHQPGKYFWVGALYADRSDNYHFNVQGKGNINISAGEFKHSFDLSSIPEGMFSAVLDSGFNFFSIAYSTCDAPQSLQIRWKSQNMIEQPLIYSIFLPDILNLDCSLRYKHIPIRYDPVLHLPMKNPCGITR